MIVFVLGSAGQVGAAIRGRAPQHRISIVESSHADVDICDLAALTRALVRHRPDVVVNCAAYTDVDSAEREPAAAFAVNCDGAANVATACTETGARLVHLSTDYVFGGAAARPDREDDPIRPLGTYAASKAAGEDRVRARDNRHVILRTSWVFGAIGGNFVKTMLRLSAAAPPTINVVDDQHGCPTPADAIADCVLAIAERIAERGFEDWGTYHFCGRPATTWYRFAAAILAGRSAAQLIPIRTADMPRPAPRPLNSVLDCRRIRLAFGIEQPAWIEALDRVRRQIDSEPVSEAAP